MNISNMNIWQIRKLFSRICRQRRVFTSVDAGGNKVNITGSVVRKIADELHLRRRIGLPGLRDCTPHRLRVARVSPEILQAVDAQVEKHGGAVKFLKTLGNLAKSALRGTTA